MLCLHILLQITYLCINFLLLTNLNNYACSIHPVDVVVLATIIQNLSRITRVFLSIIIDHPNRTNFLLNPINIATLGGGTAVSAGHDGAPGSLIHNFSNLVSLIHKFSSMVSLIHKFSSMVSLIIILRRERKTLCASYYGVTRSPLRYGYSVKVGIG